MAQLIRLAKSASDWSPNDLEAYNIVVKEQKAEDSFCGPLPDYTGPVSFVQVESLSIPAHDVDAVSKALLKRLDLAMTLYEGEESAVDDFIAELLRALGYEIDNTAVVRTRKTLRLFLCGERVVQRRTLNVLDTSVGVLLVVQEEECHLNPTAVEPEPQLIAEAIAAFQENNAKRDRALWSLLKEAIIPGITMMGNFSGFYKIKVTDELNYAIPTRSVSRTHDQGTSPYSPGPTTKP